MPTSSEAVRLLLKFPYQLGDVVQFGVVLRHLGKYRPHWQVEVLCQKGPHKALEGLCHTVWTQMPTNPPALIHDVSWWPCECNFDDRPSTRAALCLLEMFGLDWDRELGRYHVHVSRQAKALAAAYYRGIGAEQIGHEKFRAIAFQMTGKSQPAKKNLTLAQFKPMVDFALSTGRVPVIFDSNRECTLVDGKTVFCPTPHPMWDENGPNAAEMVTALIQCAEAFVGVDSGPGKCAGATDTPSLICWTGFHPGEVQDPSPNMTHLLPAGQHGEWFVANYDFREYNGDLEKQAKAWLGEVLGEKHGEQHQSTGNQLLQPKAATDY